MKLIDCIEQKIWEEFNSYKNVENYIEKWHHADINYENFTTYHKEGGSIDLNKTLHNIDGETLIKIAVDLGIETPDFIVSIPIIKNVLKDNYQAAYASFEKALKQTGDSPDLAIALANSTLEGIVKGILQNDNIAAGLNKNDTLYKLTQGILKEFSMFPCGDIPNEIRNIGSSLLNISQNIEKMRSDNTNAHGKIESDYIINDPLYAFFVINSISTVGLFLISYYEKSYNGNNIYSEADQEESLEQELAIEDIPF